MLVLRVAPAALPVRPVAAPQAAAQQAPQRSPSAAVPLDALRGKGERAYFGPGGTPRLLPLAPFNPQGKAIVFVHGIGTDPADAEPLILEAQRRGMQVYVMAYDTLGVGAQANARGFASELRKLSDRGIKDVEVVGHSLGSMTLKAALNQLDDGQGKLQGFDSVDYVALSGVWGGVGVSNLTLASPFKAYGALDFGRQIAPDDTYWQSVVRSPLPKGIRMTTVEGDRDEVIAMSRQTDTQKTNRDAIYGQAAEVHVIPGLAHTNMQWDPRTAAIVFHEEGPSTASVKPRSWLGSMKDEFDALAHTRYWKREAKARVQSVVGR